MDGEAGNFQVKLIKRARYVDIEKCTGCGECTQVCPVELEDQYNQGLSRRKAVHKLYPQAIPGAYCIQKGDKAPCRLACPAGINVQGYVQMVKVGDYKRALEIIMDKLPLPGELGRICPHPCEDACRRAEVDKSISIRELKRFAADSFDPREIKIEVPAKRKEKVAIVGSGPAGLSCAYHLARKGIASTIFEAAPEPGGMLRYGIPAYRLPRDILDKEIEIIRNLGVEIRTNTALGREITVKDLFNQGYKAIYLALGTQKGIPLRIPGEDAEGVLQGVDFLREFNQKGKVSVGNRVAIIGGGNVAIDCARSAIRLGAKEVKIIYRRSRQEMPASEEEIRAAEEEGVKIVYLSAPQKVIVRDGKVAGLTCIEMELGEPDSSGRRRPIPIPGTEYDMEIDQVIAAIGQRADLSYLEQIEGLRFTRWGTVETDPVTYETSVPGIFAGGDLQTGPGIAIGAIAAGMEAAESIERYIDGRDMKEGRGSVSIESPEYRPISEDEPRLQRKSSPHLPVEERKGTFAEVELGLSEDDARKEAERCLNCGYCCECMRCVDACKAEAINHQDKEEEITLNVGSIILCSGSNIFDLKGREEFYHHRSNPNVLTSLEFERILSASGPTMGELLRPSDGKEPKKIAWLQCVGSRDVNTHPYCSSVCCMYAIKEAVIAKEHATSDLDCAIFFMDMRTYGKDYEKYYERAKKEGVRFIRCRIHTIEEDPVTKNLILRYVDENGESHIEQFDMVVLSVGMEVSAKALNAAHILGIGTDEHGFAKNPPFSTILTSKQGMYACGLFSEPKDIPFSVMEASAAASEAKELLAPVRGTLVKEKIYPEQINVSDQEPRIGVFVCNCGINIGGIIDVPSVVEYARSLPGVGYVEDNLFTCSQDTQEKMKEVIKREKLNRIVVAACTPRTHEPLFQETLMNAGLNKYLFEMVNIRNQCSWVHSSEKEKATEKAKDLIRMAVARARLIRPLPQPTISINNNALIIGGGIAGMTAALSLANQGFHTFLVEKSEQLGGSALSLHQDWKGNDISEFINSLKQSVENHPNIELFLGSEVEELNGFVGNFETIISQNGSKSKLEHGVVIIATGAKEYKPNEYLYGQDDRILTALEFDNALKERKEIVTKPKSAVFIQCVGSRDSERPYCSKVCCTHSIQAALKLKEMNPDMNIYILYRDIRTYGMREELYRKARIKGILFIRYDLDNKPRVIKDNDTIKVIAKDHILKRDIEIDTDLVVLASAIVPNEDNENIAQLLRLPLNEDGFFIEAHAKLRPVDFATDGIFLCGLAHYPKPIEEAIAQAKAAASRASVVLAKDKMTVEGIVSEVNEGLCRGCGKCVEVCPFGAISLVKKDGREVAQVQMALCKGCGSCAVACPTGAAHIYHFEDKQVLEMVETALGG